MTISQSLVTTSLQGQKVLRPNLFPARTSRNTQVVTTGQLIRNALPVPHGSILLGLCRDRLPFLIELTEPAIGAILVASDEGQGKTHQLQIIVDSALRMNAPKDFQVFILTSNPDEWNSTFHSNQSRKYLQGMTSWYAADAPALIDTALQLAESRRQGDLMGARILFILDDLERVNELPYETQINLHWLLEYGPQSNVWMIAAVKAGLAGSLRYWIDVFRTRIIGRVLSQENASILATKKEVLADCLSPGEFKVWTGHDWRSYRLPVIGD